MERRNGDPPTQNSALVVLYVSGWYFFSMSISVYNKWMFGRGLNFRFPLFVTAFHQTCLFCMSTLVLYFRPHLRPTINNAGLRFWASLAISAKLYLRQIMPCAVASAGDIGLSNVSLEYVSLSLYTMLKTSSLIFVLIFGLLFRLEVFNWRLVVIVIVMSGSVIMMTRPSDSANMVDDDHQPIGIVLILAASMVLGLRWSFTQLLLKKNEYTKHPMLTIFYISPFMTLVLLVFALFVEGWDEFMTLPIWEVKGNWGTIGLMIVPGFLAFMMTLCEFQLLSVAQVLTLSIAGIFKELLTIMLGSMIFGDTLSVINCVGLVITFLDILWYNYYRYTEKDKSELGYATLPDQEELGQGEAIELKQH
ncbi:CIC11C00000000062 [Sungouiella intermedia]|uniref:CIC11C00000000062 n=1 Tax=Sungouiella intermedia TaxID=45354 RepID=A0A1L0FS23_9ASCO|nr:CIC11C00000000062 [[Candida] intermedia]SGZ50140.1 CIC11C00000004564 [[Candida] intermedia]